MFPTGGGSAQRAQENASHQPHQGFEFLRALANLTAQNSPSQQPASQYIVSLGQQPVHAAQLAAQHQSPTTSLYQAVARQTIQHQESSAEQASQSVRDDSYRRPSLMSNFFLPHIIHQQGSSRDDSHLDVDTSGTLSAIKVDPSPGACVVVSQKETDEQCEKKATSDRLESIEKDRKQADQQVEFLTKRRERLKNLKKESEQEVKDVKGEVDERENIPLWQRIIAENKRKSPVKAQLAEKRPLQDVILICFLNHSSSFNLVYSTHFQFFYEPINAPGMSDLLKRQKTFDLKLQQSIAYRQRVKAACYRYNDEAYNACMRDFLRKIERWENSPKKIARDLKNREIFERAFPEMKRSREERERSCRNDRISLRGQETVEDLPTTSENQVDDEYKMRNAAAIPPLLVDESMSRPRLFDNKQAIIKNAADENRKWYTCLSDNSRQ
ncbi:hypothetical protein DICVIV_07134 [Dictyocaulus viviparus]|uniref:Uncharacterized protein n=1 Tax=Dictyocaulus viviparus TaxID=29172 RepID=A0A0D8XQ90_DICVI|nr:hypothetical protein DICVIV_07134 [Dictyocaulus viviparus]